MSPPLRASMRIPGIVESSIVRASVSVFVIVRSSPRAVPCMMISSIAIVCSPVTFSKSMLNPSVVYRDTLMDSSARLFRVTPERLIEIASPEVVEIEMPSITSESFVPSFALSTTMPPNVFVKAAWFSGLITNAVSSVRASNDSQLKDRLDAPRTMRRVADGWLK